MNDRTRNDEQLAVAGNHEPRADPAESSDPSVQARALKIRVLAGVLALVFPVILVVGSWIGGSELWRPSISAYFHSYFGGFFVIGMLALSVFLLTYRIGRREHWVLKLGAVAAGTVGFIPTAADPDAPWSILSLIHGGAAAVLFGCLIVMVVHLFTLPGDGEAPEPAERRWYWACGGVMAAALAGAFGLLFLKLAGHPRPGNLLFWLEVAALWAFAVAVIAKNMSLLRDLIRTAAGATRSGVSNPCASRPQGSAQGTTRPTVQVR